MSRRDRQSRRGKTRQGSSRGYSPERAALAGVDAADGTETNAASEAYAPGPRGVGVLESKVLVLNRVYAATRIVSARRAFTLLLREAAEIIHIEDGRYCNYDFCTWAEISDLQREFEAEAHDWVRTPSAQIAVPRIIRLLGYSKLHEEQVKLNRKNLFARDRNRCQYCGHLFSTSELSIDHVVPRSQGGGDTWTNLVCSCVRCNARKGGRTPEQARMPLIRKPAKPKRNPAIALRLGHARYDSWKAFLDEAYWSVELDG